MGVRKFCRCFKCWNCCPKFKAKLRLNEENQLQNLPKPVEADVLDGVPYIDAEKTSDVLIIRNVDPCIKINGPDHHTSLYDLMNREIDPHLVIRRGQPFTLEITLSRPYNEDKDAISFIFQVEDEEKPSFGQGTLMPVPMTKKADKSPYAWNVVLQSCNENNITVSVTPAVNCVVAKWKVEIDTKIMDDGAYSYSWPVDLYILFNPWCKNDQVYMKDKDWLQESVASDSGLIWRGTANRMRPCIWKYAQFEKNILECSLFVIRVIGKLHGNGRADPIKTARTLAAAVNSVDDDGVVMGNWSENYSGGTAPTKWLGSKEILQEFYTKKKPVKFGQCWVFSGVLATICRAIGIPARVVTNYSSAHDTQGSLTVDYFMDEKGEIMEELNSDSIWNFHVWNEVWMERPDLGKEYAGWQAVDSTPQEKSEDMYRCGPTSVIAVKQGEVLRPYDCAFLFAEVNADKVYWKYAGLTQPLKLLGKDVLGIGQQISTKAAGQFEREDITHLYKHPEKSEKERATMYRALQQSQNLFARYYLNEEFNDIHFHFELKDDIKIGEDFDVSLVMRNKSATKDYKITVNLRVEVVTYTGKVGDAIKKEEVVVTVKSQNTHEVKLHVTYNEYFKRLIDQCAFNISCLATVHDTKFEYYAQDDFRVRKPDIKIKLHKEAIQNQEVVADIHLENPLPIPLKKCEFTVECPGLEKQLKLKLKETIQPGGRAQGQFKFVPPKPGRQNIAAKFVSKELDDVDGFLNFMVIPTIDDSENAI